MYSFNTALTFHNVHLQIRGTLVNTVNIRTYGTPKYIYIYASQFFTNSTSGSIYYDPSEYSKPAAGEGVQILLLNPTAQVQKPQQAAQGLHIYRAATYCM